jgi:RNA polymerase sigma-70 factor (ECF subfamily)
MNSHAAARAAMLSTIPDLRAFAVSLCGSRDQGDDLVQETLLRAWSHLADFEDGTNMAAWLFTILRNHFVNECRRRRRWIEDVDGQFAERVTTVPEQEGWAISTDLRDALTRLPVHQRDAVILVGAAGKTLEEAALICGCEIGTIKSRVHRGRARLAELMADAPAGLDGGEPAGAGQHHQALPH